ncbi:uncharacterized protein LOC119664405, partial [Teleopsis dalmanni]
MANLNPFLDKNQVLRVGGRLINAKIGFDRKHPIIIAKGHLANLIINEAHRETLHGGHRLMENVIKRRYWIFGLKNLIKKCIRECVRCTRYKALKQKQLMGDLPEYRVNVSAPFAHCGVDYAGPLLIKCSKGRGQKTFKGYVAVFVCMATKALHLELVSDMTSDSFLAALKRLFARRGKCSHIYSDNGTNFVGASKKLDKDLQQAIKSNVSAVCALEAEGIKWHFIPPASPHFGGLWESAVKSIKHHLKRVVGENKLTYEELSTLLTQIEGILNSRPLCANVDDNDILTPGHFLIGHAIIDYPEAVDDMNISSLNRWKIIQAMKKHFWKRWKEEYLTNLQQRYKWKGVQANVKEGQVVIVKNEETYPGRWPLGKIIDVHPGKDNL